MRAIAFLLPVLLASCGNLVTQREILIRAKAEVAAREPWADSAVILVEQKPSAEEGWFSYDGWFAWVVRAGEWDYSEYPSYKGINLVPGTERQLKFSRDGCLIGYAEKNSRCPRQPGYTSRPPTGEFSTGK